MIGTITRTTTIAALATVAAGTSVAVASAGISGESATQIARASAAALRSVKSFSVVAAVETKGATSDLSLKSRGSAYDAIVHDGAKRAELRRVGSSAYVKGNEAYWQAIDPNVASEVAGKWFKLSASKLSSPTGGFVGSAASCLAAEKGLTKDGFTTVDGQRAIVLRSSGRVPGTQRGELDVAAVGAPYPLRVTATGPRKPGGHGPCSSTTASTGTATFSDYNTVPPISAPAGAISVPNS